MGTCPPTRSPTCPPARRDPAIAALACVRRGGGGGRDNGCPPARAGGIAFADIDRCLENAASRPDRHVFGDRARRRLFATCGKQRRWFWRRTGAAQQRVVFGLGWD